MPSSKPKHKTARKAHGAQPKVSSVSQNEPPAIQTQSANQDHQFQHQESFLNIRRDWSQAYFSWPLANDASGITATSTLNNVATAGKGRTPMERWQMETSRQGFWDNVGQVPWGSGAEQNTEVAGELECVGTDDASWWPCEFVRGPGKA